MKKLLLVGLLLCIKQVNAQIITSIAGDTLGQSAGYTGDGSIALHAKFSGPNGIALDASNNIYIVDHGNHAIRKITASTNIITTIAGTGTSNYTGDGGPATAATLGYPNDVAV